MRRVIAAVFAVVLATATLGCGEKFIASKYGSRYHLPSCPWAQEVEKDNRVVFDSKDAAVQAGLNACTICNP